MRHPRPLVFARVRSRDNQNAEDNSQEGRSQETEKESTTGLTETTSLSPTGSKTRTKGTGRSRGGQRGKPRSLFYHRGDRYGKNSENQGDLQRARGRKPIDAGTRPAISLQKAKQTKKRQRGKDHQTASGNTRRIVGDQKILTIPFGVADRSHLSYIALIK